MLKNRKYEPKSPGVLVDHGMIVRDGLVVHAPATANNLKATLVD